VVSLAAAYRETFGIVSADATEPLGPEPSTAGARAAAWQDLTDRIAELREQVAGIGSRSTSADVDTTRYDDSEQLSDTASHESAESHLSP
jgi:hypothetical protein